MSKYKLIAFDMDGTLLNSNKEILPGTLKAIQKAFDNGKEVVLCTGRCIAELNQYIKQIPGLRYIIGVSGALVYDIKEKKAIYANPLKPNQVNSILDVIKEVDAMPHILTEKSIVQTKDAENMDYFHMGVYAPLFEQVATKVDDIFEYYKQQQMNVEKLNVYHANLKDRDNTREKLQNLDLVLANAEQTSIEISAKGTTKGTGLEKLCQYLNINIEEAIAVGDADNDLDVLKKAGLGIAMENANANVKAVADVVVGDCNSDGCVTAIEQYLLK